jgi:hypothetical protein
MRTLAVISPLFTPARSFLVKSMFVVQACVLFRFHAISLAATSYLANLWK